MMLLTFKFDKRLQQDDADVVKFRNLLIDDQNT